MAVAARRAIDAGSGAARDRPDALRPPAKADPEIPVPPPDKKSSD